MAITTELTAAAIGKAAVGVTPPGLGSFRFHHKKLQPTQVALAIAVATRVRWRNQGNADVAAATATSIGR
jgi:hypothetical protein